MNNDELVGVENEVFTIKGELGVTGYSCKYEVTQDGFVFMNIIEYHESKRAGLQGYSQKNFILPIGVMRALFGKVSELYDKLLLVASTTEELEDEKETDSPGVKNHE